MKRYNIQIDFVVEAYSESGAEQKVWEFIQQNHHNLLGWNIVDWDFLEFIPSEEGTNESTN